MQSGTSSHTLIASVLVSFGLGFCVREYLLPWYQTRRWRLGKLLLRSYRYPRATWGLTITIAESADEDERRRKTKSTKGPFSTNRQPRLQIPQHWLLEPDRPTITEDDIASGIILASNTARTVLRISERIVAKFGPDVDLTEADTISFIRGHTDIPVPKILNAYSHDGKNYIIMEYIEGTLLKDVSYTMAEEEFAVIVEELRIYISSMRRLQAPEGVLIGSVTEGPAIYRRQFGPASGGPFQSEHDFNE
jgi:hypothetical protein